MKKSTGNSDFGLLLKKLRNQANLKQEALAQAIHCANSEISRFEKGKKLPSQLLLHNIVNVLKEYKSDIEEDSVSQLWNLAGYIQTPGTWNDAPPLHQAVLSLNQLISEMHKRKIPHELIDKAMEEVLIVGQANLGVFLAKEILKEREWKKGLENLENISIRLAKLEGLNAQVAIEKAQAYYGDGSYLSAINYYKLTLRSLYLLDRSITDLSQKARIQFQIGDTLISIGSVYRRKSQMSVAEDYYKQAGEIFSQLEIPNAKEMTANSLRKRAGIANYLGQANKAIGLLEECNKICDEFESTYSNVLYKSLQHMGWSYRLLGRWDDAIELNNKAYDLIQQQEPIDKWEVMKAHIYLGESYRLIRNGEIAKQHYEEAQRILHSIQDEGRHAKLQEGMILLGLGRVYLKNPTQLHLAEKFLTESLQMHYQLGEELMVAAVQNELGELHTAIGEFEQALDFLIQSRDYFKRMNADFYYLSCQSSLCKCYYKGRDYFKGRKIYSRIYEVVNEVKNFNDAQMQTHLAKIKLMAGRAYLEEGNLESASLLFCASFKHAINFNKYVFLDVWDELSDDITTLVRSNNDDVALSVLQSLRQDIQQTEWENDQDLLAKDLLAKIKTKEKEIKTLLTHTQKKKSNNSGG